MAALFAGMLVVHGAIHLLGVAKAFRFAELPALAAPISQALGWVWLLATLLFLGAAAALFVWPRWWWAIGAAAVLMSTIAVVPSWADAKFGAAANTVALVGVVFGFLAQGPWSLRAAYDHDVDRALVHGTAGPAVTDADLATLPELVQRYLRRVGVVGQPRARNVRIRLSGRIRNGPNSAWMPLVAEQHNVTRPPMRLFYMTATLRALPLQGYHRFVGERATMRIKAASVVRVVDAAGPEMNQGETVTMLNDLCVLAAPMLLDADVEWEPIDGRTVRATLTNAGQKVSAVLSFNEEGDLVNFWSDDRYQSSPDGKTMTKWRWSTPIRDYRQFGPYRLASRGEARWHEPQGDYAYIELAIEDVQFNVQ